MTICKVCWIDKWDTKENRYFHNWKRRWLKCRECTMEWRKSEHERELERKRDRNRYKNNISRRLLIFRTSLERRRRMWYWNVHSRTDKKISQLWIRPNICPICWYEWRIVAHHPDINVWNEIVFCCQICHDKIHRWKIECPKPTILDTKRKKYELN